MRLEVVDESCPWCGNKIDNQVIAYRCFECNVFWRANLNYIIQMFPDEKIRKGVLIIGYSKVVDGSNSTGLKKIQ